MPEEIAQNQNREALIQVRGVHRYFGEKHVLKGADLDIYEAETVCILGTSGGGKSVMVKHMTGLLQPDEGSVKIDDVEISTMRERELSPIRKKVGMMFQNGALFDSMNVAENIAFPMREAGIKDKEQIQKRITEVLEIVRLPGQELTMPSDLSGGMRKRVALARAIVARPACVFYDEPHAGLDPVTADSIDRLIKRLEKDHGITNVVITHELRSVFRIANRIVFMKEGVVYWEGTPDEMKASNDPVIVQFLSGSADDGEKWESDS